MKRFLVGLFAVAFLLAGVGSAGAVLFTLDSYDLTYHTDGDGLLLQTANILPQPYSFDLEVGESTGAVSFFRVWTNESDIASGEDTIPKPFSVDMYFSTPPPLYSGTAEGDSFGYRALKGFYQGGVLVWDNPTTLNFGTGGTGVLEVTLSNAIFNPGDWFSTDKGYCYGADITATFTYVTAPIPEPGTMLLLGMGVLGIGVIGRKKLMKK